MPLLCVKGGGRQGQVGTGTTLFLGGRAPAGSQICTAQGLHGSLPCHLLQDAINGCPEEVRPKVLVSASAVGFYGISESQTFSEASGSGSDYLAEVSVHVVAEKLCQGEGPRAGGTVRQPAGACGSCGTGTPSRACMAWWAG